MDPSGSPFALSAAAALIGAAAAAPSHASPAQPLSEVMAQEVAALARKPADVPLLIASGRTALELGDAHAAAGFFGRARELAPQNASAHLGMASTLVALNRPEAAFPEFARARQLGSPLPAIAPDLGLAYDLAGEQRKAQATYLSALNGPRGAEARRRLALSLAISGDAAGATTVLQPLVTAGDAAALRTNAFILALKGDLAGSTAGLNDIAPGRGSAAEPFLSALADLSAGEKAAALNLGIFPSRVLVRGTGETAELQGDPPVNGLRDLEGTAKPMEYGRGAQKLAPPDLQQQKKAQLALFGVFPDP